LCRAETKATMSLSACGRDVALPFFLERGGRGQSKRERRKGGRSKSKEGAAKGGRSKRMGLGRVRSFIDNQERGRRLGQRPGPWNPRHRVSPLILSRTSSLCPSLPRSLTEGTEHCLCLTSCTSTVLLFFFNAFTVLIESLLLTFATYVSISIECVRLYCFN
jgi:hypothetical protein